MHAICTIVAHNYLGQALTLETSIQKHNPEHDFFVLIVDGIKSESELFNQAKILVGKDLDMDQDVFVKMSSYYDLFEISTAVKPTLLRTLISRGYETVTFLDPDTQLFGSLVEAINLSIENPIVLTPHRLSPVEKFNVFHDEKAYLKYGVFNLGFISVNKDSVPFLIWWESKLRWSCTRYMGDTCYTDQKWIDLVPAFFEYFLLTHKGYNLAPWNLSERPLSRTYSGKLMAGGHELIFVHYSQMSSLLSIGKDTQAWEQFLESKNQENDSLRIAKELTKNYGVELRQNRETALKSNYEAIEWPKESFHLRAFRIESDRKSRNLDRGLWRAQVKLKSLADPIVIKLERFSTFNGLVDGISRDASRVFQKFLRKVLK
jgi:hypothetical protein